MRPSWRNTLLAASFVVAPLAQPRPTAAQAGTAADLAVRLAGMTAVSGYEQRMSDSLLTLLPGAQRDRAGNVIVVLGQGAPVRLAACSLDEWGYVVGGVRTDGWISLRRVGAGQPALWDQMHEGHRMTIWTRRGPVPAVMAVPSTHLARGRDGIGNVPFSVDDALLDTGARAPAEIEALGIRVVDAVSLEKNPHRYGRAGQQLAAPEAAARGACAALATAAAMKPTARGTVVLVWTVESKIRHRGLLTAANGYTPERTLLLNYPVPRNVGAPLGQVDTLSVSSRYPGTAVETIDLGDVERLALRIAQWIGGTP